MDNKEQLTEFHSILGTQSIHNIPVFKEFLDKMPGGFFIYHADGDEEIIYANSAFMRLFGCESLEEFQELTGNSFRGIVHPDDLDLVEESIKEQIAHNQYDLDYVEYRIIKKDGGIRWIDDYGHFIHSETDGDIFYVFAGDATEKKMLQLQEKETLLFENRQKEQELLHLHQEHLLRLEIIEGLSFEYESIFLADLDANTIQAYRVSSRFQKVFENDTPIRDFAGFDSDYINTWVCPNDREMVLQATTPENIRRKLSCNKSFHINYRIYKEGKPTYIQLRIVNVGSAEHISQILMGYRNIDEEILQELKQKQILEDALNQATLANKAKNVFLSNMSHDIRTPMNAIVGFASLAKSHLEDRSKVSGYLDMITSSSDSLLQLLNNVFEVSRIESNQFHIEEGECNLLDLVQNIHYSMHPRAAEKNISFTLDTSKVKHNMVYCDQQKLSKVLIYLIDNALKYTKTGGKINISVCELKKTSAQTATYQFVVEDNGIGISKKFLPHIFDPFERAKNTTLSGIYGSGLGLTITKKIVDVMGGTINISSAEDRGSKFTVTLGIRIMEQTEPSSARTEDMQKNSPGQTRIMIVDDNEINLEIGMEVLRDAGYQVDTATDGSIAVEKIKNSPPGHYGLILMDLQMPVMNGYDAARAIRGLKTPELANIPIIALSANTFEEDKKMTRQSGMNAHLAKPIDTPLLYDTIEKILAEHRQS